ncbi:MAG TPA: DNA methyltransferase [Planctomycetaceae bacterium]|jgi:DNA modification methylase|nr:DNA methyltransferase [Planctomycetaceae bacterium]
MPSERNALYCGDNLEVLRRHGRDETVDLVYLDPPFNSGQNYHQLFKTRNGTASAAPILAFEDTWRWDAAATTAFYETVETGGRVADALLAFRRFLGDSDLLAYLSMMAPRLVGLRRVLKNIGSIYLHCDPTASHYLKMLMDAVFGPENFRNEIVWRRTGAHGPRRSFGPIHDTLLFYSKTSDYFFQVVKRPYMKGHVDSRYMLESETGRYKFTSGGNVLTGAGATGGESGRPWRGFDPAAKNRHWAIPGFLAEQMPAPFAELGVLAKLDALYAAGLIEIRLGVAWPTPVRYLSEADGQPLGDIWAYQPYTAGTVHGTEEGIDADVAWMGPTDPERLGYQTQKPLGLLARIIGSSCPPGGLVLDPFCGCGTTLVAAQGGAHGWIGIDQNQAAIGLVKERLREAFGLEPELDYALVGESAVPTRRERRKTVIGRRGR